MLRAIGVSSSALSRLHSAAPPLIRLLLPQRCLSTYPAPIGAVAKLPHLIESHKLDDAHTLLHSIAVGDDSAYPFSTIASWIQEATANREVLYKAVDMLFLTYLNAHMFEAAYDAFEFTVEKFGVLHREYCVSFVLALKKSKRVDVALRFLHRTVDEGDRYLSSFTLAAVVDLMCKTANVASARDLFDEMCQRGVAPNVHAYGALLNAYCKINDFDSAGHILRSMDEKGVRRDAVMYATLISAYSNSGRFVDAELAFSDMVQRGIVGNLYVYAAIISANCEAGNIKRACALFDECIERGLQPNNYIYGALIHGLCQLGQIEAAEILMAEMQSNGVEATPAILNMMRKGYLAKGMEDKALEFEVSMKKFDVSTFQNGKAIP